MNQAWGGRRLASDGKFVRYVFGEGGPGKIVDFALEPNLAPGDLDVRRRDHSPLRVPGRRLRRAGRGQGAARGARLHRHVGAQGPRLLRLDVRPHAVGRDVRGDGLETARLPDRRALRGAGHSASRSRRSSPTGRRRSWTTWSRSNTERAEPALRGATAFRCRARRGARRGDPDPRAGTGPARSAGHDRRARRLARSRLRRAPGGGSRVVSARLHDAGRAEPAAPRFRARADRGAGRRARRAGDAAGNYTYQAARLHYPTTIEQIQEVVRPPASCGRSAPAIRSMPSPTRRRI